MCMRPLLGRVPLLLLSRMLLKISRKTPPTK
jgi:hypothetical protein